MVEMREGEREIDGGLRWRDVDAFEGFEGQFPKQRREDSQKQSCTNGDRRAAPHGGECASGAAEGKWESEGEWCDAGPRKEREFAGKFVEGPNQCGFVDVTR